MSDPTEEKPECFGFFEEDTNPDNPCNKKCKWLDQCFEKGCV